MIRTYQAELVKLARRKVLWLTAAVVMIFSVGGAAVVLASVKPAAETGPGRSAFRSSGWPVPEEGLRSSAPRPRSLAPSCSSCSSAPSRSSSPAAPSGRCCYANRGGYGFLPESSPRC